MLYYLGLMALLACLFFVLNMPLLKLLILIAMVVVTVLKIVAVIKSKASQKNNVE